VARNDVMVQHLLLHGLVLQEKTCTPDRARLDGCAAACSMVVCCANGSWCVFSLFAHRSRCMNGCSTAAATHNGCCCYSCSTWNKAAT
jgi:hypothetical protein